VSNLDFLNLYWETCDSVSSIRKSRHFLKLDELLTEQISGIGIREDPISTRYKGTKRWDMHFPDKKVAIEYKTLSSFSKNGTSGGSLGKGLGNRLEEAIGSAFDLKQKDSNYRLGYLIVFVFRDEKSNYDSVVKRAIDVFDKLIEDGLYDFFCPLFTRGLNTHGELSETYSFDRFIGDIRAVRIPESHTFPLYPTSPH